jgi:hypothetical protein
MTGPHRALDLILAIGGGAILLTAASLALAAGHGLDPLANVDLCWSRILLDRACPGCGLTRSFVALAGGHLARALECNPTGPLLFAATLLITLLHTLRLAGLPLRLAGADIAIAAIVTVALIARGFHFYV